MLVEFAAGTLARLLWRAVVNSWWRMGNQAGWHGNAVERTAMEEGDLVVVDVAVIPRCALGARDALGGLGQKVHYICPGGLHEQMHGWGEVDAVRGHHVVVVDVEREGEVVAAPAFHIERIMLVEQRCRAALVDQPHLVLVAAAGT